MKYSEIVNDVVQAELAQMAERESFDSWRLGELANNIFFQASLSGASVTMNLVCTAVAYFRQCSASKVQQVARIESLFPPQDRASFRMLPFSHFEFASRFGDPIAVLKYSTDNYPISVHKLEMVFSQQVLAEQVEAMEGNGPPVPINKNFAPLSPFENHKPTQTRIISGMVDALVSMIQSRFFEKYPIHAQVAIRDNLLTVISALQKIKIALGEPVDEIEMV